MKLKRTAIMAELKRQARSLEDNHITNTGTSNEWRMLATEAEAKRAPKYLNWKGRTK